MAGRRFEATEKTIYQGLLSTMRKMGATSLRINPNEDMLNPGLGAEIVFDRNGKRYVFRCSNYRHRLDNLRAAQLTISYLYQAIEAYGVEKTEEALDRAFEQFFLAWAATPDDTALMLGSGNEPWWVVLGVHQDATVQEIRNAYRALAQVHHPDRGGTDADFKRLRAAYDQALKDRS